MNKLLTSLLILLFTSPAYSENYGYDDDSSDYPYESSTGTSYEYDLSDPSDRVMYGVDPAAQLMDSINPDPMIEIDRNMNEYGGGAKW